MNETERDLRELFESKAREAGAASPAPREVVRRGRRRQAGTVAVAGITTLAVAIAAVSGLRVLNRADADVVPGETRGNPAFTATIGNFTLTVPQGWTLIDQVPWAMTMAVALDSNTFSCEGTAVEGGNGGQTGNTNCGVWGEPVPGSAGNAASAQVPSIPLGGLPILTLANEDPGLGRSVCDPGRSLPTTSAVLYIGLDFDALRVTGVQWESEYPVDRRPLTNVLEGDAPIGQMPCGPGGYSRFQAGGMPFFAWAGFGQQVPDADRQAIVDAFGGMQASDGELANMVEETPGYVIAGAIRDDGPDWTLEAHPTDVNVDLSYHEAGDSSVSGAGDFTVPEVDMELSRGGDIVFGAVRSDAETIELRPADGSAPVAGSILELPPSLGASFDALVVSGSAAGEIVATGPDGLVASQMIGGEPSEPPTTEPSLEDRRVQSDLRNAYVAAKTHLAKTDTYEGFTPEVAASIEPSLTYNTDPAAITGEISIRDVASDHIVLVGLSASGTALCIAEQPDGSTTYGAVDAQTAADCVGGEVAWGQDAHPTASPPATPPTSIPVNAVATGVSADSAWNLVVEGDRLVLQDESGSELASTSIADGPMTAGTYVFGSGPDQQRVVFGIIAAASPDVRPLTGEVRSETSILPAGVILPRDRTGYITEFLAPFDGEIVGIDKPCEILGAFSLQGNEATRQPPPIYNCDPGPSGAP